MLELRGLTRRFGEVVAIDDVSFSVPQGHMVGFVGPNGAGKARCGSCWGCSKPTRIVLGKASAWEPLLSIAISVGTTAALIPVATKVYSRAVLQTGRVRIRQVRRQRV